MRIAMWSGPRNLSTAMMYAFAARDDCTVVDEPFYAAFLQASGEVHPMQEAILTSQPTDPTAVIADLLRPAPEGKPVVYQKQMSHHMLPDFPTDWVKELANVFLLRHPARVIASYQRKREEPKLEDIGVKQQCKIFSHVTSLTGNVPVVIDSDDILANPAKGLSALCEAVGLSFDPKMLHWQAGGNAADGVWASHWYGSVWSSTGLRPTPIKPLPALPENLAELCQQAMPYYHQLAQYKLVF